MLKVLSQKGKENIVKDGFAYRSVGSVRSGEERWRCCNSKCVAKLYTMEGGMLFSRLEGEHNHLPREQNEVLRKSISNSIKRKAEEEIDQRPSKLIHGEISKCPAALEALTRNDIKCIRDNLTNARLKQFPKLPKSREEVQEALSKLDITTAKNEVFLLANNLEKEITIFSCDSNLRYLCERDTVLMDGTFEFSPKHFTQLFTIHGYDNGTYIPLIYCLLPDKRKQTYTEALGMIKEECIIRNLQLMPKNIVVDFEQAIHSSIDEVFPASAKVGCRFHLGQSWWRKIQQLGLACTYKDSESEAGKWLHYCFGLTYLSPEVVEEVFCDLIAIQPAGEKLSNFADYLTETYIDSSCCLFPPKIWAADSAELWRTTNSCESFHSRYNELCPSPHPNIFVFLKNLKICQVECYIRINSVSKGEVVKSRKTTCLRQEFLEKKITQVKNGQIDLLTFVKCVAYKSAPNVQ